MTQSGVETTTTTTEARDQPAASVHDCSRPKNDPTIPAGPVDLPGGDSYGLGQPGSTSLRRPRGKYFVP